MPLIENSKEELIGFYLLSSLGLGGLGEGIFDIYLL